MEQESGRERGTKGPVVGDTHEQLPQLLKDKGQSSISDSDGSRRQQRPWFPQACGWLTHPRATSTCSGLSPNRLGLVSTAHTAAEPTTAWSHAGDLTSS